MSGMQADLRAAIAAFDQIAVTVEHGRSFCREALDDLTRPTPPLPAPALTEDAIVAALKADPAMAGRVIAGLAGSWGRSERHWAASSAGVSASMPPNSAANSIALQSLAVALAAASYRG